MEEVAQHIGLLVQLWVMAWSMNYAMGIYHVLICRFSSGSKGGDVEWWCQPMGRGHVVNKQHWRKITEARLNSLCIHLHQVLNISDYSDSLPTDWGDGKCGCFIWSNIIEFWSIFSLGKVFGYYWSLVLWPGVFHMSKTTFLLLLHSSCRWWLQCMTKHWNNLAKPKIQSYTIFQ
jgi:hypothetical protein